MKLSIEKFEIEITPEDQKAIGDTLLILESAEREDDQEAYTKKLDRLLPVLNSLVPVLVQIFTHSKTEPYTGPSAVDPNEVLNKWSDEGASTIGEEMEAIARNAQEAIRGEGWVSRDGTVDSGGDESDDENEQ